MPDPEIVIEVTQLNIKRGERGSAWCCPIAHAVRRTLKIRGGMEAVAVNSREITLRYKGKHIDYKNTAAATRFIYAFDAGKPVEPFKFPLVPRKKNRCITMMRKA